MRYLKGTIEVNFRLEIDSEVAHADEVKLIGYSDADYAADRTDRKSVGGGELYVDGTMVGWFCKKQNSVAFSTIDAEFVAASQVASELLGLSELLGELGIVINGSILMPHA
ncbi:Integrase catalytic core protein [Phytophthora cinnamomi]|uniref:Integrase catalytic core protein n=1 Tax=Phytophthora cinnamomi TaxID=4785 RepID=UPI0035594A14|nr:Integrase catalytic core protein [Phytophthora cinnamomi]